MRAYVIRRLLLLIPIVFGVSTITFIMIHSIPGDPIQIMMGTQRQFTPEEKERISKSLGLNDPLPVQYFRYIGNIIFKGDMGMSITRSTLRLTRAAARPTLTLGASPAS